MSEFLQNFTECTYMILLWAEIILFRFVHYFSSNRYFEWSIRAPTFMIWYFITDFMLHRYIVPMSYFPLYFDAEISCFEHFFVISYFSNFFYFQCKNVFCSINSENCLNFTVNTSICAFSSCLMVPLTSDTN